MILVVVINIIFLFKYSDASVRKKGIGIADFPWQHLKSASQEVMPDIPVSFENIQKVRAIRDSLAYLISLKHMTFQDTLTFVRVMDEFQKISAGTSGIPPLKMEDLRMAGRSSHAIIDTTGNKYQTNISK